MTAWRNCACSRCRTRGLMGPAILIALGVLFFAGEYTSYSFGDLWPILLIVVGAVKVAEALASSEGHVGP